MTDRPFFEQLGDELVRAHGRLQRRRARRRTAGSIGVVVLALAVSGALFLKSTDRPVEADLKGPVTNTEGWVAVSFRPTDSLDKIRAAYDSAGIAYELIPLKTGPSKVGKMLSIVGFGDSKTYADRRLFPPNYDGKDLINFGVAAPPGQPYDYQTFGFDPGEPFEGFEPRTDAAAVLARAQALGLQVRLVGASGKVESKLTRGARVDLVVMFSAELVQINFR